MASEITYPLANGYALDIVKVCKALQTDEMQGITNKEAEERTIKFGPNSYQLEKKKSIWLVLLAQFNSPLVYLLFAAAIASFYFGNAVESISILVVILLNAFIGFFMELQARTSMNALKEMDQIFSKVIRHGKIKEMSSEQIVPGDLIILEAGDILPADGRIVENNQLQCDESALTGESFPMLKQVEAIKKNSELADQSNMVFKGTAIMNGNAKVVVTAISEQTELGKITAMVDRSAITSTPLDLKINKLTRKLIWITLIMTCLFSLSAVLEGKPWVSILETSIALAVAAFPEGLPIVATVALAYGMLLMARKNAIVKKLSAVETLGGVNVIFTDKTGTLTQNKIYVEVIEFPNETLKVAIEKGVLGYTGCSSEKCQESLQKLILIGSLCNDASLSEMEGGKGNLGDPVEVALLQLSKSFSMDLKEVKSAYPRIAESAFSAETKMMGTLNKHNNLNFSAVKGSIESIIEKCIYIENGHDRMPLTSERKATIVAAADKISAEGYRVLAFAYKESNNLTAENYLNDLIYVGLVGFLDPARPSVKQAILDCRTAGIKTVMITGDHPLTALNIALKTGIATEQQKEVILGSELPDMANLSEQYRNRILSAVVFARTTPKQKLEIVEVYQKAGFLVAMTGDGVNDAPALKQADIGIAMGLRGTQVAKEAASIVLKDDSFLSISKAVAHGREIFQNIQRFVIYLVSCNLSEIFTVTLLSFLVPQAMLLPLQILFLNMITDVFPALALGLGKGDASVMQKKPRNPELDIISNRNWIVIGLYSVLMTGSVVLAVYYCRIYVSNDPKVLNNVAFITLAFAQLFHVFNMSSTHAGIWANEVTKNKFVWFALLLCFSLILLSYLISQTRESLNLVMFPTTAWSMAIAASLVPLVVVKLYIIISKRFNVSLDEDLKTL